MRDCTRSRRISLVGSIMGASWESRSLPAPDSYALLQDLGRFFVEPIRELRQLPALDGVPFPAERRDLALDSPIPAVLFIEPGIEFSFGCGSATLPHEFFASLEKALGGNVNPHLVDIRQWHRLRSRP